MTEERVSAGITDMLLDVGGYGRTCLRLYRNNPVSCVGTDYVR